MDELRRAKNGGTLFGVCKGWADFMDIDVTIVRIAWLAGTLFFGGGLLLYIICLLIMPVEE